MTWPTTGDMSVRLETTRLVIRTFESRDLESWLALVNDPEVGRYTSPSPPATLDTFRSMIERRHAMEHERGYAMWAVDGKETGAFVGQCGLYPAEGKGPEVELAYHFGPVAWNRGYATEAATAVLALVMPENAASCRVAEEAGMRFEGIATYYDIAGLRKYMAERVWWSAPQPS
jgi:RimJ/RimL family protein N-acetyltransferase